MNTHIIIKITAVQELMKRIELISNLKNSSTTELVDHSVELMKTNAILDFLATNGQYINLQESGRQHWQKQKDCEPDLFETVAGIAKNTNKLLYQQ